MSTITELTSIYDEISVLYDRLTDARDYEQNQSLSAEIDSAGVFPMDELLYRMEALIDDIHAGAYVGDEENEEDGDLEEEDY